MTSTPSPDHTPDAKRIKLSVVEPRRSSRRVSARLHDVSAVNTPATNGSAAASPPVSSASPFGSGTKASVKSTKRSRATAELQENLQSQLDVIAARHDARVRQLFHMENFVSLVRYDPEVAKQDDSTVFRTYKAKYDLETKVAPTAARLSRSSRVKVESPSPAPAKPKPKHKPAARPKYKEEDEDEDEDEDYDDNDYEEYEEAPRLEPVDVLIPSRTKYPVTHPWHVAAQPQYGRSLDSYLDSFVSLDEDVSEDERLRFVEKQVDLRRRIAAMIRKKLERGEDVDYITATPSAEDNGRSRSGTPLGRPEEPAFSEPVRMPTHQDHLSSQAAYFGRLMSDERRAHISQARRLAQTVDMYHRRLSGQDEKERRNEEKRMRQLARKVGADVLKKWKLAEKVVLQRRQQLLQEQQRAEGKVHLDQILQHSAELLKSRRRGVLGQMEEEENDFNDLEDSEADGSDNEADSDDEDDSDDQDSDVMSDSDDEQDEEEAAQTAQEKADASLSVEQLRAKYANLDNVEVEWAKKDDESESDESVLMDSEEEDVDMSGDDTSPETMDRPSALGALFGKPKAEEEDQDEEFQDEVADQQDKQKELEHVEDQPDKQKEPEENGEQFQTKLPPLLHGTLRLYQHHGLDWLAGLYNGQTNGILADEMGLGKTIQTIALISYLAWEKHVWGPHLIVVPTSVMLNWEMEFKRFAPGFKVLTYYGNPQQRKDKRKGWNKEDTWHVCITSYQLVLQDQPVFRRKKWHYLILDEAHNIKNFRSQRWQALLNFNSQRRLLLTGTPLQNNLVELWSLLYFLMPSSKGKNGVMPEGFANLSDFQEWFARPVDRMVEEGGNRDAEGNVIQVEKDAETTVTVMKLHQLLRPYLLRRLKADVEKQMPAKYEHIVYCRLSNRQRFLYDDFMSRAQTRETLASGNYLSIINCLMQLRKVCNHPDLFEVRPIVTSFAMEQSVAGRYQKTDLWVRRRLWDRLNDTVAPDRVNLGLFNMLPTHEPPVPSYWVEQMYRLSATNTRNAPMYRRLQQLSQGLKPVEPSYESIKDYQLYYGYEKRRSRVERLQHDIYLNQLKSQRVPIYGHDTLAAVTLPSPLMVTDSDFVAPFMTRTLQELLPSRRDRSEAMSDIVSRFAFVTPPVVCLDMTSVALGPVISDSSRQSTDMVTASMRAEPTFHNAQVRLTVAFPDKRLLQYDCGKLQRLAVLLRDLTAQGHRALIFTQMTKVLDILEQFLNIHGYRYLRLDGATKIEQRQILTERFNTDARIPVFILSTRSGGLGINLTGADTVIFYDSDWNPSMDKQCQDRCHRIGQTRDVHIYRFVSEYTIESNILKKATQKQILDDVVIQDGDFTTDYFNKLTVSDMLGDDTNGVQSDMLLLQRGERGLAQAEDNDDANAAKIATIEAQVDEQDFSHVKANSREQSVSTISGPENGVKDEHKEQEDVREEEKDEEKEDDSDVGHVDEYMIRFIERGDYEL